MKHFIVSVQWIHPTVSLSLFKKRPVRIWDLSQGCETSGSLESKVSIDDLSGSIYYIESRNLGGSGFTPIINPPSRNAGMESPRFSQFGMVSSSYRRISFHGLSYDHRAINGAEGGGFLRL